MINIRFTCENCGKLTPIVDACRIIYPEKHFNKWVCSECKSVMKDQGKKNYG